MADYTIRFLISNFYISAVTVILYAAKRLFKNRLTSRMQYNLWFLLLLLLAVPFIPVRTTGFLQIFTWIANLYSSRPGNTEAVSHPSVAPLPSGTAGWMNDFALSVSSVTPSMAGAILCVIWLVGILAAVVLLLKTSYRLHTLKKSALPLQNPEVRRLYGRCLDEMNITKRIPVYSTAFLKSPVIVGLLKPCIYLPIHLIADYKAAELRYMLLHELQHYRHRDALANYLMNLAGVIYWFNPVVWFALKEMRNDREVACDTSVLKMLGKAYYGDYGITLINFAQKVSLTAFPFGSGLGGSMDQMKRRIINIASYEEPTFLNKMTGLAVFSITAVLLMGFAPALSACAAEAGRYEWNTSEEDISYLDLSSEFEGYEGSFVLYDMEQDHWTIYDMEHATTRVAPESTYKIYDSLFALEEGIITPEDSFLAWDSEKYPFEAWNRDQNLLSAMTSSVNWYFQALDRQLGKPVLQMYLQKIGYGNEDLTGDIASYWLESSLKISPVEQVKLLTAMYDNSFGFAPENISAIKDSLCLSSSEDGRIYGKTGTGQVDGQNVNGWFIGFVETYGHTYFFAANIGAVSNAAGNDASGITLSILSGLDIWS